MDNKGKRESKGYGSLENIGYIVANAWQHEKLVFIYFGIFTILSAISPFLGILFPKFILDELTGPKDIRTLGRLITVFFYHRPL